MVSMLHGVMMEIRDNMTDMGLHLFYGANSEKNKN